jgi:phosphatidylserine/phosphatidylglycerophosphate/cardiolipin synthase-like enzyme
MKRRRSHLLDPLRVTLLAAAAWTAAAAASSAQTITPWFSPSVNSRRAITDAIDAATTSIDVAMFYFSSPECRDALLRAHARAVPIRLIIDRSQATRENSTIRTLRAAGIPIRVDSTEKLFHCKYAIIDATNTFCGSTNWTNNGWEHNAEALVSIIDATTAATFTANFETHWAHAIALPYTPPTTATRLPAPPSIFNPLTCPRQGSHHHGTRRRSIIQLGSQRHRR